MKKKLEDMDETERFEYMFFTKPKWEDMTPYEKWEHVYGWFWVVILAWVVIGLWAWYAMKNGL